MTNLKSFTALPVGLKPTVAIAAALLFSGLAPAWATERAEVVSPNDRYGGKTYAQWNAAWWQWGMQLPVQDAQQNPLPHPFFDDPGFDVTMGQSGGVWFLAAPFGTTERTCAIPRTKALFVAILNAEASNLEGLGNTAAEQRETAQFLADHILNPFFIIDGQPVRRIGSYRSASPQFAFTAPSPWIFGDTGGAGTAVGDGYYVLIEPLSKGQHTLHYGGAFHFSVAEGDPFDLDASIDMTYHLTVQ